MGYAGPSQFERLAPRENRVGDRLPWSHHVDDFTVAPREDTLARDAFLHGSQAITLACQRRR